MILIVKGADFSANAIGQIIDFSDAKELLTAHYPSHSDDDTAQAFQVFMNTLGKGQEGSIWSRLRWLLLPIFGNSVTEDIYDIRHELQATADNPTSLTHLRRGLVFSAVNDSKVTLSDLSDTTDSDLASIFYVKEALGNQYCGSGGAGGYLRSSNAPIAANMLSTSQGGDAVSNISVTDGKILMFYLQGLQTGNTCKFKSENGTNTYYFLQTNSTPHYNKTISRLCSHNQTDSAEKCNTSNPIMMMGSVKNMTDVDATTLINAITTLRSALNI